MTYYRFNRRSFLKRSAVLLVYVAPIVETFVVAKKAEALPSWWGQSGSSDASDSPKSSSVPKSPSTSDSDSEDKTETPTWGTRF